MALEFTLKPFILHEHRYCATFITDIGSVPIEKVNVSAFGLFQPNQNTSRSVFEELLATKVTRDQVKYLLEWWKFDYDGSSLFLICGVLARWSPAKAWLTWRKLPITVRNSEVDPWVTSITVNYQQRCINYMCTALVIDDVCRYIQA